MNKPLHPDQLRSLVPLNALSRRQLRELQDQLTPRPLLAGELLFGVQDSAATLFFLLSGELLLQAGDGRERRLVAGTAASCYCVGPGPRWRRAHALSDCSVLAIDSVQLDRLLTWRQAYQDLLVQLSLEGHSPEWLELLLENPLFAKVPPANVRRMLDRLESLAVVAGQTLIRQGDVGDGCFFLKAGRAEVVRDAESGRQLVAELEVGACFGEEALLADRPRNATVTMLEDGVVLRLARADFHALLEAPVVADVSLAQAARLLDSGAQWLDIRLQEEYERGHALQALHMPLDLLRLKARLLDRSRTYLCYCDSGKRSASAVFLLTQLGFSAFVLRDGVQGLPAVQHDALLCQSGSGYLARSGGRIERSRD